MTYTVVVDRYSIKPSKTQPFLMPQAGWVALIDLDEETRLCFLYTKSDGVLRFIRAASLQKFLGRSLRFEEIITISDVFKNPVEDPMMVLEFMKL